MSIYPGSKFFTNEPEKDLYSRFAKILKSNTQFFDVLVGYFRTSGFFRMYEALEPVEKIRILVGLNVDKYTVDIIDAADNLKAGKAATIKFGKEIVALKVENEFQEEDASSDVEVGVRTFVEWLNNGKLEMRIFLEAPIHAKVYIARKDQEKSDSFGTVITGSSNFSEAGLKNNLEFNVELRDEDDVRFALEKFEELWIKGVDIKDAYITALNTRTWLRDDITPYELYLKTLYEFFKHEINNDLHGAEELLPEGYMRLQYQLDAVIQARQKLDAYNGVFISDVVGLGKTYICAMLAKSFRRDSYKLIVCPPVLQDYWRSVLQEFDVSRWDVVSLGKLEKVIQKGTDKYDYVFVDEAHRFRNSDTNAFTDLHTICRGKKVVLISATPINNWAKDIENQIYLFQDKHNGTINGIKNLEKFFASLEGKLKGINKDTEPQKYLKQLSKNAEEIREKLIRHVMIRRTRSEVEKYYGDDLAKQKLSFPKVGSPEKIVYTFNDDMDSAFNYTIGVIKEFKYSRYMPLTYLKDQKKYAQIIVAQKNMGGFMKGILIKRLESSFYAFKMTLGRFIESYKRFIEMFDSGTVYVSKKVNVYDLIDEGDFEKLNDLTAKDEVWKFSSTDFVYQFIKDLRSDLSDLESLQSIWNLQNGDPKLEEFKNQLTCNKKLKGNKVIIFTESRETSEYLRDNLKDVYGDRLVQFSGSSSNALKEDIENSFDPKYKDMSENKYDALITTDILAEGINLHRANVVINYDLPWNPTRIMQRVGRINRVGTEHDSIHVFNFFMTAQSSHQIPLEQRILQKLQAFHDTLGNDFKYLTETEEVSAQGLFDSISKAPGEEVSTNPELGYLEIIRKVRDNEPELFNKIKKLPVKAKAGKKSSFVKSNTTITFIRKGALNKFLMCSNAENGAKELGFMEAVKFIEAKPDEPKVSVVKEYFKQLEANDKAFDNLLVEDEIVTAAQEKLLGNDAKTVKLLRAMKNDKSLTNVLSVEEISKLDILISRFENGEIPSKIAKDIMKATKAYDTSVKLYYAIVTDIVPETYFASKEAKVAKVDGKKQVVLSCFMVAGDNK